jgi:hypothetical protein
MPPSEEIQKRITDLTRELDSAIPYDNLRDVANHWTAFGLMFFALAASAIAALGGISGYLTAKQTGFFAAVPGAIALFASTMKFQEKSNWHYRRKNGLKSLRRRLSYELPESPTADNVAAISEGLRKFEDLMQKSWEEELAFSWAAFTRKKEQDNRDTLRPE